MKTLSCLVAFVCLAATSCVAAQSSNRPHSLGGNGRFVFGQINESTAEQYMLDTLTGRLWRLVDTADGGDSLLEPIPYVLPDGRTHALPPEAESPPARAVAEPGFIPPLALPLPVDEP